jgi:uncharacterized protein YqeY
MLIDTLKAAALEAMKSKDVVCTTVLRVALGEMQTAEARANKPLTEEEAQAILRKLVKSNEETLAAADATDATIARATLQRENEILTAFLPAALTTEQIAEQLAPVAEAIRAAKNDGQATGIAMKHLKASGVSAPGTDVGAAVKRMRQ